MFTPIKKLSLIQGDEEVSGYIRTAFVNEAATPSTGVLNDPAFPFSTYADAVFNLWDVYIGQSTTIILQSDVTDGALVSGAFIDGLLAAGLTVKSDSATIRAVAATLFGFYSNSLLTLENVTIAALYKSTHQGASVESAGTITGVAGVTITVMDVSGYVGNSGGAGANGQSGAGTPDGAAKPADNSPPEPGVAGGDFDAAGGDGGDGADGGRAWNVTLLGVGTLSSVTANGGNAGSGGSGGVGNSGGSSGGAGGAGGDSNAMVLEDGAAGGGGGDCDTSGGNGGNGGNGGVGGTIYYEFGWSVSASSVTGGSLGFGGPSGAAGGNGNGGAGGVGGTGAVLGNQGATGANGIVTNDAGIAGAGGSTGADGSVIQI